MILLFIIIIIYYLLLLLLNIISIYYYLLLLFIIYYYYYLILLVFIIIINYYHCYLLLFIIVIIINYYYLLLFIIIIALLGMMVNDPPAMVFLGFRSFFPGSRADLWGRCQGSRSGGVASAAFGTKSNCCRRSNLSNCLLIQWIGLREKNLRKTPIFHEKIFGFRLSFSLKPIH